MKSNIFIFHGTEGYPEENWFPWLKEKLEAKGCRVFVPQFPSPPVVPAQLSEWFETFKKYEQCIDEETILVGHSLGGKFLLRVLENLAQPVKGAFFVATPIGVLPIKNNERDNAFTGNDFNWQKIKSSSKYFGVFHSDNDPYVSLANGERLARELGVELSFIPDAGHFNKKSGYLSFPALLQKIETILPNK